MIFYEGAGTFDNPQLYYVELNDTGSFPEYSMVTRFDSPMWTFGGKFDIIDTQNIVTLQKMNDRFNSMAIRFTEK